MYIPDNYEMGYKKYDINVVEWECPVCGKECEHIYIDKRYLEILGCDNCIGVEEPQNILNKGE